MQRYFVLVVSPNRSALRFISQFLSVYLLTLLLVAAPLHNHSDATPEDDRTATVTAADDCQLCDWLVQPALALADVCFAEDMSRLPKPLNAVAPSPRIAGWTGFSDSLRAPPVV